LEVSRQDRIDQERVAGFQQIKPARVPASRVADDGAVEESQTATWPILIDSATVPSSGVLREGAVDDSRGVVDTAVLEASSRLGRAVAEEGGTDCHDLVARPDEVVHRSTELGRVVGTDDAANDRDGASIAVVNGAAALQFRRGTVIVAQHAILQK